MNSNTEAKLLYYSKYYPTNINRLQIALKLQVHFILKHISICRHCTQASSQRSSQMHQQHTASKSTSKTSITPSTTVNKNAHSINKILSNSETSSETLISERIS